MTLISSSPTHIYIRGRSIRHFLIPLKVHSRPYFSGEPSASEVTDECSTSILLSGGIQIVVPIPGVKALDSPSASAPATPDGGSRGRPTPLSTPPFSPMSDPVDVPSRRRSSGFGALSGASWSPLSFLCLNGVGGADVTEAGARTDSSRADRANDQVASPTTAPTAVAKSATEPRGGSSTSPENRSMIRGTRARRLRGRSCDGRRNSSGSGSGSSGRSSGGLGSFLQSLSNRSDINGVASGGDPDRNSCLISSPPRKANDKLSRNRSRRRSSCTRETKSGVAEQQRPDSSQGQTRKYATTMRGVRC